MELEREFKNNQFNFGEDLYKINPKKEAKEFFRMAVEKTIEKHGLKPEDRIKVVFLHEDTNCCTKFYKVNELDTVKFIEEDFDCIDFNVHRTKDGEFKIATKWIKFSL